MWYMLLVDDIGALCGFIISAYIIFVSFYMAKNDSFKWYTVNIFVACIIGNVTKLIQVIVATIQIGFVAAQMDNPSYDITDFISLWIYTHYRVVSFAGLLEIYILYDHIALYRSLQKSGKFLYHCSLTAFSILLSSPYLIVVSIGNAPPLLHPILYNYAVTILFIASNIFIVIVVVSVCKKRSKTPAKTFRRRLVTFLIYVIPMNLWDAVSFVDSILLLVKTSKGCFEDSSCANDTWFEEFLTPADWTEDAFRSSILAICTTLAFSSYRKAFMRIFCCKTETVVSIAAIPGKTDYGRPIHRGTLITSHGGAVIRPYRNSIAGQHPDAVRATANKTLQHISSLPITANAVGK